MIPEGRYFGVDGCPGGWVAIDAAAPGEPRVFPTIHDLWRSCSRAARILIDVPIGLSDAARACDLAAKAVLGRWNSRVFLTPPRPVLYAEEYRRANQLCRRLRGAGLSKQTWFITPKIREVDEFLRATPAARGILRECHPEVCFWGFAGRALAENKLTEEGLAARAELLATVFPEIRVRPVRAGGREVAGADDVLDALIAAWCASGPEEELQTLPERPPVDAEGLRIEMVYRRARRPAGVHLLPKLVEPSALAGGVVLVIDQLRASSTIIAALDGGAAWVRPVLTVEEARRLAASRERPLLGGERGGVRIEGFDLGNSPAEYGRAAVAGRGIVFTTTNGTAALLHAARAKAIGVAALSNRRAAAAWAARAGGPVHVLCAGTHGLVSGEDVLAAGAVVEALLELGCTLGEDDAARLALEAWARARAGGVKTIREALRATLGGRNLIEVGLGGDVDRCSRPDRSRTVPVYDAATGLITRG